MIQNNPDKIVKLRIGIARQLTESVNVLGKILSTLDPETHIVSFGEELSIGQLYIILTNPKYKEVPEGSLLPALVVTRDPLTGNLFTNESDFLVKTSEIILTPTAKPCTCGSDVAKVPYHAPWCDKA